MKLFGAKTCRFIGAGPVLPVPDVEAAVAYYCKHLGFQRDFVVANPADHGSATRGRVGIQFTLQTVLFTPSNYPGWVYLFVEHIDLLAIEFAERGLSFTQPLGSRDHGMREFEICDLNGFRLRFGQYL